MEATGGRKALQVRHVGCRCAASGFIPVRSREVSTTPCACGASPDRGLRHARRESQRGLGVPESSALMGQTSETRCSEARRLVSRRTRCGWLVARSVDSAEAGQAAVREARARRAQTRRCHVVPRARGWRWGRWGRRRCEPLTSRRRRPRGSRDKNLSRRSRERCGPLIADLFIASAGRGDVWAGTRAGASALARSCEKAVVRGASASPIG